jgi:hypothetical protein
MNILGLTGDSAKDQITKRNITSLLIKPVQRIMRYHLLLKVKFVYSNTGVAEIYFRIGYWL